MKRNLIASILFWNISLTILFFVAGFWITQFFKSDYDSPQRRRAVCYLNMRNVQQAVRSYANMESKEIGYRITMDDLMELDFFSTKPVCPEGYAYEVMESVPEVGQLYLRCTNPKHMDFDHKDW